jgi:hypothetical protein
MTQYSVYNIDELKQKFSQVNEQSSDVNNFFTNFKFSTVINYNNAKNNTSSVFKNLIKEDVTKSKIISLLNKLHHQNLTKVISGIREIVFQTEDELNELVNQCIQKIKRDNDQTRPLIAALCWELQTTYFVTSDGEKIYFRKLLLSEIKKEYLSSINYDNEDWYKEKSDRIMILIGTMFNGKIIEFKIMNSIINDLKKLIEYKENGTQEQYEKVEKAIQQLSCLVSCITLNEESKKLYGDLDEYLEKQINIYEEKKCISKRIRIICKNTIDGLRK